MPAVTLKKLRDYLQNNSTEEMPSHLQKIEARAREKHVAVISREARAVLSVLLKLLQPGRILEIGTGTGFSALWFAWVCGKDTGITTVELIEHRIEAARKNFAEYDQYGQIELIEGDARTLLSRLQGSYDLIFLDAAKRYYPRFLPHCLRLLEKGGLLVADDVLFEGLVLRDKIPHKRRTMGRGLKEFLEKVLNHSDLDTYLVPWGQGMSISLKRNR